MNKLKLTILFFFMSLAASAQRLAVESLKLRPNDLSARNVKNQRHDLNGKPCALLKVMVLDNITKCSSGNIGEIVTEGPVKLIYITSATPSIELSFQYHYPLTINFADYGYKHLEGNSTYDLNLVDAMQMMMGNGKKVEESTSQGNNVQPNANNTANVGGEPAVNDVAEMVKIADDAYKTKDYSKAMKWYLKAAEQGDAHSHFRVGSMYFYGYGVPKDYSTALKWYLKAAEQGDTNAMYNIGEMYVCGFGVKEAPSVAIQWFLKAAEQGDAESQSRVGLMYYYGKGVPKDYSTAFKWYLKAAENGGGSATFEVANMYEKGQGVEKSIDQAVYWYKKAADKGYNCKEALKRLGY